MLTLQRIQNKVQREIHGSLQNRRQLAALRATGDDVARRVAQAFETALGNGLDADAQDWVDKIEALRTRLAADETVVSGVDYGAGSPGESRTAAEAARGVQWTKSVRRISAASKSRRWGQVLMQVVREVKPAYALELGTCVGISAAYQAAGLKCNGAGKLTTMEGAESLAQLSRAHFVELGLGNVEVVVGDFGHTLPSTLAAAKQVDYAYIDGHHDGQATQAYFEQILPHVPPGGVLIFDDIRWSAGMEQAWQSIVSHPGIRWSVDCFQVGLCVVGADRIDGGSFKIAVD